MELKSSLQLGSQSSRSRISRVIFMTRKRTVFRGERVRCALQRGTFCGCVVPAQARCSDPVGACPVHVGSARGRAHVGLAGAYYPPWAPGIDLWGLRAHFWLAI